MPEFSPGESRNAVVPMTNPTTKAFDYSAELYMGTDLALMARKTFHLEAGGSKNISLPIIMPGAAGTYPVNIGVYSGEKFIPPVHKGDDVVITLPTEPFTIVLGTLQQITAPGYGAWYGMKADYFISNPTSKAISHHMYQHITVYYKNTGQLYDMSQMWNWYDDFELTLGPGESYHFQSLGGFYNTPDHPSYDPGADEGAFLMIPLIGTGRIYKWWLEDELGNRSPEHVLNT